MENRKGSGIFLGVVSVATLVVAIIGATFAYFSASVTANETIDLTAYEFNADITLTQVSPTTGAKLIPLVPTTEIANAAAPNNTNLLYAMNVAADKCIDDRGYQVCAVYQVTVTNNGSAPLTLTGALTTNTNRHASLVGTETEELPETYNKFINLTYQTLTSGTDGYELSGAATTLPDENGTLALEGMTVQPGEENAVSKYFVVYLNDPVVDGNTSAQNTEMGVVYKASVTYTDSTSGSKLTGSFTVTNTEDPEVTG